MATPRQVRPGWEYGYLAGGASSTIKKGVALVIGADNTHAQIASALGQGKWRGVCLTGGSTPNGFADPTLPDDVCAQKQGIAQALCPSGVTSAEGDQAICNASGEFITRVPYSFSAFVWGQFDEGFTVGAQDEWHGLELLPHYVETIRTFDGFVASAPVAGATKYANGPSGAVAAAAVPLAMAGFTGETLRNLRIGLETAPAAGESLTATLYRNPFVAGAYTGWAATTITCQITGTGLVAVDQTHAVVLNQGDLVALQFVASNNGAYAAASLYYGFDRS